LDKYLELQLEVEFALEVYKARQGEGGMAAGFRPEESL